MSKFHPGTSTYTAPHTSRSCGGDRHVDIYRTDEKGYHQKTHSTDPRDIRAGENLSKAMREYRDEDDSDE